MRTSREREICLRMRNQGHTQRVIADALNISKRTVGRWLKQGTTSVTRHRPARRRLSPAVQASIVAFFAANNTATLRQAMQWLIDVHGVTVSIQTIWNCCRQQKITWKKGSKAFSEMSSTRVQYFLQNIAAIFGQQVIALDEAAFFYNHVRGYAWSARGTRAVIQRPGIRGRAHSLLLCVGTNGIIKWQLYEGAVNAVRFAEFLEALPFGSQLVLDNAVIHRATQVLRKQGLPTVPEIADKQKISLTYLPPYAPMLNPVELCFNHIRTFINREKPRSRDQLVASIESAVNSVTPDICQRTIKRVWNL